MSLHPCDHAMTSLRTRRLRVGLMAAGSLAHSAPGFVLSTVVAHMHCRCLVRQRCQVCRSAHGRWHLTSGQSQFRPLSCRAPRSGGPVSRPIRVVSSPMLLCAIVQVWRIDRKADTPRRNDQRIGSGIHGGPALRPVDRTLQIVNGYREGGRHLGRQRKLQRLPGMHVRNRGRAPRTNKLRFRAIEPDSRCVSSGLGAGPPSLTEMSPPHRRVRWRCACHACPGGVASR